MNAPDRIGKLSRSNRRVGKIDRLRGDYPNMLISGQCFHINEGRGRPSGSLFRLMGCRRAECRCAPCVERGAARRALPSFDVRPFVNTFGMRSC
ncbi:hypothetical protein [Burkholderia pseudomallei]|uniref:hypothetical protein n=1 Tax=Burkholderia pseudomallei TaxID=28450 RepID=UPI001376B275|nr:hypothetical protein [Burkholderia pseudomallei]